MRLAKIGDAGAEAGLQPRAIILSVGRSGVGSTDALDCDLAGVRDGQTVMLLVGRGNATEFIAVTVGEDESYG